VLGSTLAVTGTAAASPAGGLSGPLAAFANCGYGAERQAFLPWLDLAEYSLAPNGNLASTSGWTLDGSATSSGHDPYGLSSRSLVFDRNGDSATTPWMCVNLQNPTVRFLAVDSGGLGLGSLSVTLRYYTASGATGSLPLGLVKPVRSWEPSLPLVLALNSLSLLSSNGWTQISLEVKAGGLSAGETLSADGFWVDPCRSR
jgi:hypothetical protein